MVSRRHTKVEKEARHFLRIARKVFPTASESDRLLCFSADYSSPERNVQLPSGRWSALCACYDMFGVAERKMWGRRARNIGWIGDLDSQFERQTAEFKELRSDHLAAFAQNIDHAECTIGIAAIHSFDGPSTGFWQRHGLAACSASLTRGRANPGYAIGAAHFTELPRKPTASTLAAARVPAAHLGQAQGRKAHSWLPSDHFYFKGQALVRLFS